LSNRTLKEIAGASRLMIIANSIYKNWLSGRRLKKGDSKALFGSTHDGMNLTESVEYIDRVFNEYLQMASLSVESLEGKRILEVGPGDNLGVALRFLSAGAAEVVCADKFYSHRDEAQQRSIYQALRERLSRTERPRFDAAISLSDGIDLNAKRLKYLYGVPVEEIYKWFPRGHFDLIVSRAVIQYVYEIDTAFQAMDAVLKPGGLMVHKLDLSDHRMFSSRGMNPLTFLTIRDSLYRLMARYSCKPNRRLTNYYREKMIELNYDARVFATAVLGQPEFSGPTEHVDLRAEPVRPALDFIKEIRPKLAKQYRDLPDEDLAISAVFLVAKKPERTGVGRARAAAASARGR